MFLETHFQFLLVISLPNTIKKFILFLKSTKIQTHLGKHDFLNHAKIKNDVSNWTNIYPYVVFIVIVYSKKTSC